MCRQKRSTITERLWSLEEEAVFQRVLLFHCEGGRTGVKGFSRDFHYNGVVVPKLGFLWRG